MPDDVARFIRVQQALDLRQGDRARVSDVVEGLILRGYSLLKESLVNEDAIPVWKEHPLTKNESGFTQFSVAFTDTAHEKLQNVVDMVDEGILVCQNVKGRGFNMSDAVIFLIRIAIYDVQIGDNVFSSQ